MVAQNFKVTTNSCTTGIESTRDESKYDLDTVGNVRVGVVSDEVGKYSPSRVARPRVELPPRIVESDLASSS